jgi:hypothetical protein
MKLNYVFLLITIFLLETGLYFAVTDFTDCTFRQSTRNEQSMQVCQAAETSSFLLPSSNGIETPAENHHLFDRGTNFSKSIHLIRFARKLELICWSYSSPDKILLHRNPYSLGIGQYPSIPIILRKLLI